MKTFVLLSNRGNPARVYDIPDAQATPEAVAKLQEMCGGRGSMLLLEVEKVSGGIVACAYDMAEIWQERPDKDVLRVLEKGS